MKIPLIIVTDGWTEMEIKGGYRLLSALEILLTGKLLGKIGKCTLRNADVNFQEQELKEGGK